RRGVRADPPRGDERPRHRPAGALPAGGRPQADPPLQPPPAGGRHGEHLCGPLAGRRRPPGRHPPLRRPAPLPGQGAGARPRRRPDAPPPPPPERRDAPAEEGDAPAGAAAGAAGGVEGLPHEQAPATPAQDPSRGLRRQYPLRGLAAAPSPPRVRRAHPRQPSSLPEAWDRGENQSPERRQERKGLSGEAGPLYHLEIRHGRRRVMQHRYEVIIYWSDEDKVYVAEVPELPGCAAHGDSPESALT